MDYIQRKNKDTRTAFYIGGAGVVIIGIVVGFMIMRGSTYRLTDNCLSSASLQYHTVFLLDRSDPFSSKQIEILEKTLKSITQLLKPNERFSIYAIDNAKSDIPTKLFSQCSPGTASTANIMTETPDLVQESYERDFLPKVLNIVGSLDSNYMLPASRIIQTLSFIPELKDFGNKTPHRHLIIFSDMLQNTTNFSQISGDTVKFSDLQLDLSISIPDMSGIDVTVYYIPAPKYENRQNSTHTQFWRDYFQGVGGANAKSLEISPP